MSTPKSVNPDSREQHDVPVLDERRAWQTAARRCVIVLVMAWIVLTAVAVRTWSTPDTAPSNDAPPGTLNPNIATWSELTVLPRIGEAKALAIASYRDGFTAQRSSVAFHVPADLTAVKGIGPKTVQRIARELHFDD